MVYVNASGDESCDIPMCEANACGIPAVVFDCRGDYSDHCEYIKYGIVVNLEKPKQLTEREKIRFRISWEWMDHYHLCTRHLGINCFVPAIPETKFYDFPMSQIELNQSWRDQGLNRQLSPKDFHVAASKECFLRVVV